MFELRRRVRCELPFATKKEYSIVMNTRKEDTILSEIVKKLIAAVPAEKIYLFGSRASGKPQKESDYDLLVVVDDSQKKELAKLTDDGYYSLCDLDICVDLLVMTQSYFNENADIICTIPEIVTKEGVELYVA